MDQSLSRLSHSFPPDYEFNNTYFAKVHSILKEQAINIEVRKIYYRPVQNEKELEEMKLLHKEWFPPNYPDEFYQEVLRNRIYRSLLAVYDLKGRNNKRTIILGCITYEYKPVNYDIVNFSLTDLFVDRYSIYILTFGVINEVRNKGLGSLLLKQLIQIGREISAIKCICLDVVSYNDQAIKCYEKNGFINVKTQKDYYDIFEKNYDAEVFCYYVNGGRPPKQIKQALLTFMANLKACCNIIGLCKKRNRKLDDEIMKCRQKVE